MFDLGWSEILVIAVVAILVVGPKDLPRLMKIVGEWVSKARRMAAHFQSGVDEMIKQAELEDLRKDLHAIRRDAVRPIFPNTPTIHTTPPPSKMIATSESEIIDCAGSATPALPEASAGRSYIDPPPPPAPESADIKSS